jgi:hypothetical protein
MLDKTDNKTLTYPKTKPAPTLRVRPIATIGAQNLAKAERSPAERKQLAVQWMLGRLDISGRTGALAGVIFDVSQAAISREMAESTDAPATTTDLLVHHWKNATASERAAFGRAVGPGAVWDSAIVPNL